MPIGKANGATAEVAKTAPAPVARALNTTPVENRKEGDANPYAAKDRRILRQGVYQAVLQSPGLASLPVTTSEVEFVAAVQRVSEAIIKLVQD